MGPQIGYVLADSGARLLVVEAAFVERLGERRARAQRARDDLGRRRRRAPRAADAGGLRIEPCPARARAHAPAARRPSRASRRRAARRPAGDPLHVGHHRPGEGRRLPACAVPLVGREQRARARVGADDVLCTTLAALPHQRAEHLRAGGADRRRVVFEPRFSASGFWPAMQAAGATVVYLLGAMVPILLAQPASAAERAHRRAHRPRARASRPRPPRRSASAPASRCSKATARPRPIS